MKKNLLRVDPKLIIRFQLVQPQIAIPGVVRMREEKNSFPRYIEWGYQISIPMTSKAHLESKWIYIPHPQCHISPLAVVYAQNGIPHMIVDQEKGSAVLCWI